MRKPFFAANWKMNKTLAESGAFIPQLVSRLGATANEIGRQFDVVIAPPYTHLGFLVQAAQKTQIGIAAQNSGNARNGAFTGEISPLVIKEIGCSWVIIGHSERRHVFKEEDSLIQARMSAALEEKLGIIFCIGETLQERRAEKTFATLESQLELLTRLPSKSLSQIVVAYEPVWAIGTGENATPAQAQEVHAFIRDWISKNFSVDETAKTRILYGGSVKPDNSQMLMSQRDVDGLLVGGASLEADSFSNVILNGLKGKA